MENKQVPEIRFSNYGDEWEMQKLKDVAKFIRGSFPQPYTNPDWYDEKNGQPFVQVADIGFDLKLNKDTKLHISKIAEHKSRFVEKGKVVVALQGSIETSIGRVAITQYPAFFDRTILIFESYKVDIDNYYFAQVIQKLFHREKERAWGATISTITKEALSDFFIGLPNINEQRKIGQFLKKLNDTISLHQQELNTLKQTKQGFLQKMFPKEGESVPKLRFPRFTDDWEKSKIGKITDSFSGGTPSANKKEYYGGSIPFIRSGEINSESTELFLSEEGLKNSSAKLVKKGDVLYAMYGATSGEVGISKINGAINQAILALKPKGENDANFITQWLIRQKTSIVNTFLQGGQGNLSGTIVKEIFIPIPTSKEEQIQIGNFFKQLDELIALQQQELDALKQTKKAFLQKMLV